MPPRSARSLDSLVSDSLREMKYALAPGEHRGAALFEIELASIHLGEVSKELGLDCVPPLDQFADLRKQLSVGEPTNGLGHDPTSKGPWGEVEPKHNTSFNQ